MVGENFSFYQIDYSAGKNGFVSHPHVHNHYEIFFFEIGDADHYIDFEKYPIINNSLFLIAKNQLHYIIAEPLTYNFGFVISFQSEMIELLDKDLFQLFGTFTQSPAYLSTSPNLFSSIFREIKRELREKKPMYVRIVFDLLRVLLTYMLRASEKQKPVNKNTDSSFRKFIDNLEAHFTSVKSVKAYATLMHLTPAQLNRICKTHTNQTALNLIHNRVNLEAKRKIFFSQQQIKEIGYDLGFDDRGHFNNFFKKMNGISPLKFREKMLQIFN